MFSVMIFGRYLLLRRSITYMSRSPCCDVTDDLITSHVGSKCNSRRLTAPDRDLRKLCKHRRRTTTLSWGSLMVDEEQCRQFLIGLIPLIAGRYIRSKCSPIYLHVISWIRYQYHALWSCNFLQRPDMQCFPKLVRTSVVVRPPHLYVENWAR